MENLINRVQRIHQTHEEKCSLKDLNAVEEIVSELEKSAPYSILWKGVWNPSIESSLKYLGCEFHIESNVIYGPWFASREEHVKGYRIWLPRLLYSGQVGK